MLLLTLSPCRDMLRHLSFKSMLERNRKTSLKSLSLMMFIHWEVPHLETARRRESSSFGAHLAFLTTAFLSAGGSSSESSLDEAAAAAAAAAEEEEEEEALLEAFLLFGAFFVVES